MEPKTQLLTPANAPQWLLERLHRQQFVRKFSRTSTRGHIFVLLLSFFFFSLSVHSIRSGERTIWDCQTLDELNEATLSELQVPVRAGNHGAPLLKMTHRSSGTPAGTIRGYF